MFRVSFCTNLAFLVSVTSLKSKNSLTNSGASNTIRRHRESKVDALTSFNASLYLLSSGPFLTSFNFRVIAARIRSRISAAALFVNVTMSTFLGSAPLSMILRYLSTTVDVFPVPGPASTRSG